MADGEGGDGPNANESKGLSFDQSFALWKEHEAIAMHFNDLITRFRLQALGGTATISAVAAIVTRSSQEATTFACMMGALFVAWSAIWALDYGYYQKLLGGTVKTLLKLEKRLPEDARLSTTMEKSFKKTFPGRYHGHFWFYSMIQFALGALVVVSTKSAVFDKPTSEKPSDAYFWIVLVAIVIWFGAAVFIAAPRQPQPKPAPPAQPKPAPSAS